MGHLVANDGKCVHGHGSLIFAIDALVCKEAGSSDHVGSHAITFDLVSP